MITIGLFWFLIGENFKTKSLNYLSNFNQTL